MADWALPQKLTKDHGLVVGACGFGELTWEKLRQFNVVVLFDMSRLYEGTRDVNAVEISPEGFRRVSDLLYRFVQEGGGLYVYGVSYTHMGQGWANDSLNKFLQPLGPGAVRGSPRRTRGAAPARGPAGVVALAGSIAPTRRPAACGTTGMPSDRSRTGPGRGRWRSAATGQR